MYAHPLQELPPAHAYMIPMENMSENSTNYSIFRDANASKVANTGQSPADACGIPMVSMNKNTTNYSIFLSTNTGEAADSILRRQDSFA